MVNKQGNKMFIVYRCITEYGEDWKNEIATFDTEAEAQEFVTSEEKYASLGDSFTYEEV
jgi:hypothetical protein